MAKEGRSVGAMLKAGCSLGFSTAMSAAFEYNTPKIVHIKNKKVGLLNRLVQLAILGYVIGYGIIYQKGYQITGPVASVVTTKVKGAYVYNQSELYAQNCADPHAISVAPWDVGDLIIPPEQPDSFFVMTNTWITCNQTYGTCPESPKVFRSNCTQDSDCESGIILEAGNGPLTGKCSSTGYCEISAWCPTEIENDTITKNGPKINVSDFTVLVKNSIEFPTVSKGVRKRNILAGTNKEFLRSCTHNDSGTLDDLYCPIFSLQQIVDAIPDKGSDSDYFTKLSTLGGVVGLEIVWNCDLDRGIQNCHPRYSSKRLDDPNVNISAGFNFRFTKYYNTDGVESRKMYKAYGILFKIEVSGEGGRFDIVTLTLKLGSMLALLSIATVVCDVLVLYILGKGSYYREKKYLNVNDPTIPNDYEVIDDQDEVPSSPKY